MKIDTVKLGTIKKLVDKFIEAGVSLDSEISFETVIGSLFPKSYQRIIDHLNSEYTKGYIQGVEDSKIK